MVQSGWNSWNVVPKRFWLELLKSESGVGRPQQMPGPFKRPTASDGPSDRRKSGRCPLDLAASTATSQSKFLPSTEPVRVRGDPFAEEAGFFLGRALWSSALPRWRCWWYDDGCCSMEIYPFELWALMYGRMWFRPIDSLFVYGDVAAF